MYHNTVLCKHAIVLSLSRKCRNMCLPRAWNCVPSANMECVLCTVSAAAKLQHSSHYTCHIKIFKFSGIILSIAGMGQAFFTPSSIMPPLILPSRQMHLGHGDMVHSLTLIGLSMPGLLNGFIPASWQKNCCLYITICCPVWPPSLAQKQIQFQCDNQSLVMVINKGSEKNYWDAPTQSDAYDYSFSSQTTATHLPGVCNSAADMLSWNQRAAFLIAHHQASQIPSLLCHHPLMCFLSS